MVEQINFDPHQGGPMTGEEVYPIIGETAKIIERDTVQMKEFAGLPLMGGCNAKAQIIQELIPGIKIITGSIIVYNVKRTATFSHLYNPPIEQHWWCLHDDGTLIDFALPGVILRGLKLKMADNGAPCLEGRVPVILMGKIIPDWIEYVAHNEVVLI